MKNIQVVGGDEDTSCEVMKNILVQITREMRDMRFRKGDGEYE